MTYTVLLLLLAIGILSGMLSESNLNFAQMAKTNLEEFEGQLETASEKHESGSIDEGIQESTNFLAMGVVIMGYGFAGIGAVIGYELRPFAPFVPILAFLVFLIPVIDLYRIFTGPRRYGQYRSRSMKTQITIAITRIIDWINKMGGQDDGTNDETEDNKDELKAQGMGDGKRLSLQSGTVVQGVEKTEHLGRR